MQWLAIHLPLLPLEVFSRGAVEARPLALGERQGGAVRVRLCAPAALAMGVRPGQSAAAARALCAELHLVERRREEERRALEGVAQWAGQFTSQMTLKPPRDLLLEVGGSLRLFGGSAALHERVRRGLTALGYTARLAQAPTPRGALLLARGGWEGVIDTAAELRTALHPLPLGRLPLRKEQRATLRGMGLYTLGELLRLPTDGLGRRLGREFLRYLDRLLGAAPDPQPPFVAPPRFARTLELVTEVEHAAALVFAGRRLLLELGGYLAARQLGVQRLAWRLEHGRDEASGFMLGTLRPEREPERLLALLRQRLEGMTLAAPVRALGLEAQELSPLSGGTLTLFADAPAELDEGLLERLRARLGEAAVCGLQAVPDHRPERAWRRCAPGEGAAGHSGPERPLWLLDEPAPLPERQGRPWYKGRLELVGERERIECGWWDGDEVARDYFVARSPLGARFWIYRELQSPHRWFLHGVFG